MSCLSLKTSFCIVILWENVVANVTFNEEWMQAKYLNNFNAVNVVNIKKKIKYEDNSGILYIVFIHNYTIILDSIYFINGHRMLNCGKILF